MRAKYLFFIVLLNLTVLTFRNYAQTPSLDQIRNVKVSQLNDAQITDAWRKVQESGIPEKDAYKMMEQRGMDPIEVNLFKQRVSMLGLNKSTRVTSAPRTDSITFHRDTNLIVQKPTQIIQPKKEEPKLEVFGLDFFNQPNLKFDPTFNVATPKGYVVGPGDELVILLTGLNERTIQSKVSPEGRLQIPNAGIISVNGLTIEQATVQIRAAMSRIYPALTSGQSQIDVTLRNTRTQTITISGEVKTAGNYTVSSLATFFNVLYLSGGPSDFGSLRNIRIIRNNKLYRTVDFYTFLQSGVLDGNIRLQDQDVINFPVYTKRIAVTGAVKRPAIYELKENENLEDLINYAGGYADRAYRGRAKIERISQLEKEIKDVPANIFKDFIPRNGDLVEIGSIQDRFANRVILEGAVNRPDVYELSAGLTLSALLKMAQGLKPEAYLESAYIKRTLPNLDKEFISFNPSDVLNGRTDYPLLREDSVVIQDRSEFIRDQFITISGNVRNPSSFVFRKGIKLSDLIALAGGLTEQAAGHHIEVSRILKNNADSVANQLVQTLTIDIDAVRGTSRDIELEPLDYVNVPRLVNFKPLGNISVNGEVLFPGGYAVQRRDETALDFINRAGGLTPYGSLESAQIYRNNTRVDLDLTKTSGMPGIDQRMILLPGDSIYVPRVITFVQVSGAVSNPQYVNYKGKRFKYYINAAGGPLEIARIKGSYVQYPNGLNKPVRNFLFFRNYPSVRPGSVITVPRKDPENRFRLGFAEISGITSAVTALIGLIAILTK